MTRESTTMPTLFIPHGAGPCFFMDWDPPDTWSRTEAWLRSVFTLVGTRPRALLVVSGHWEEPAFTVTSGSTHTLLHDYHGFPEHTYKLTWPAPGSEELAKSVQDLLAGAGLPSAQDSERGLDHGVFVPFKLINPDADIPVVQLSLRKGLDPAEHFNAGRALAPLRDQGVLIVGSGMSFHNMQQFRRDNQGVAPDSERFDAWLGKTVSLDLPQRERQLLAWESAPGGRAAHPREEHLIPLHVVAGAAGSDNGRRAFQDQVLGSVQSAFVFGTTKGDATGGASTN